MMIFRGMIILINFNDFKTKVWDGKFIVSIKLTNKENAMETMYTGIQKGDQLYIIAKNNLEEMIDYSINNKFTKYNLKTGKYENYGAEAIVLVAIPDILHKRVFDLNDNDFINFKNQFDYEKNEDGIRLDEISGYYSELIWENGKDIPVYFIPSELILGYITFDNMNNGNELDGLSFTENSRYFTKLSIQEQKKVIQLIKKTYVREANYSRYCSLIKKRLKK